MYLAAAPPTCAAEVQKSQAVRLADVLLLGPFMVWAGLNHPSELARLGLVMAGVATVAYNGANYLGNLDRDPTSCASGGLDPHNI